MRNFFVEWNSIFETNKAPDDDGCRYSATRRTMLVQYTLVSNWSTRRSCQKQREIARTDRWKTHALSVCTSSFPEREIHTYWPWRFFLHFSKGADAARTHPSIIIMDANDACSWSRLLSTSSVSNYNSFDLLNPMFDNSSYSRKNM